MGHTGYPSARRDSDVPILQYNLTIQANSNVNYEYTTWIHVLISGQGRQIV